MSAVPASLVKELRERTGAGVMECRTALEDAKGDLERAAELLKQRGLAKAEKKAGRMASEGVIVSYVHGNPGRIGVLLELNCETDFVARTDRFASLAKDLAMQVAATGPSYLKKEDVPAEVLTKVEDGRADEFLKEACLLEQPFIKDPSRTVDSLIKETIAVLGENVVVRRFCRYQLGETLEVLSPKS